MKKILLISSIVFLSILSFGQTKIYSTTGIEIPFYFADLNAYDSHKGSSIRFQPAINITEYVNFDFGTFFGIFTGLNLKNVGFKYNTNKNKVLAHSNIDVKKKFRTINLGIPLGFKLGNFNKFFAYGGYEIGFPIHYKEKTITNTAKHQTKEWFSEKVTPLVHGFFIGVEFPYGMNIKFNWNINYFFNQLNSELIPHLPAIKYNEFDVHTFAISLNWCILENIDFYYNRYIEKSDEYYY